MIAKHLTTMPNGDLPGAAKLKPGWAVALEFSSHGGIEYEPAIVEQDKNSRIKTSALTLDDENLDRWVRSVRNASRRFLEKHAVHVEIGVWYLEATKKAAIEEAMSEYRNKIIEINNYAKSLGSKRITRCEYWSFPWVHKDLKLRARMGQLIFSRFSDLREAYTDTYKDRYRIEMVKCFNLDRLVAEPQASLVRNALNATQQQRHQIIRHYGGSNVPLELLRMRPDEIEFDFGPIDAAIAEFAPMKNVFLTEQLLTS